MVKVVRQRDECARAHSLSAQLTLLCLCNEIIINVSYGQKQCWAWKSHLCICLYIFIKTLKYSEWVNERLRVCVCMFILRSAMTEDIIRCLLKMCMPAHFVPLSPFVSANPFNFVRCRHHRRDDFFSLSPFHALSLFVVLLFICLYFSTFLSFCIWSHLSPSHVLGDTVKIMSGRQLKL